MRKIARKHGPEAVEGPLANPPLAKRYPLVSNSGARTQFGFRSQHYNIASLVKHQPKPLVHMHPRDADTRDIADGDPVDVVSPRGRVRFWAKVTDNIVPGAVEVNMGGGGAVGGPEWRQANVNELTDPDNYDPISGFPVFKALLCEIEKVRQSAGEGWIASFVGRDDVCSTRHGTQPA
ncbi:MAG: hypothetical protein GY785_04510 [Gammaproteobacteria bacterium]|nr:hypothetical protein [Gammaproteobacteria bacterium]